MDSVKTKAASYSMLDDKAIAQIVAMPEKGKFRIYVAWEWQEMADKKVFAICKSRQLYESVEIENILETADYGWDITHTDEAKKLFANIF